MNAITIQDPTEQWAITLSGTRGSYRLEANFDWLKQKELFRTIEKEYSLQTFARTNFGSVIAFRATKEQVEHLVDNIGEMFAKYFIH